VVAKRKRKSAVVAPLAAPAVEPAAPAVAPAAPALQPWPAWVLPALAGLVLVLALIASAARSAEWPVLVALGRWLAAAMALVVAAVALAAKRGWRSPGWLPVIGVALGVLAAMALTGRQSLAGRSFADIHSASFGLPTELAWVLIGLGVQRIRSRDDLIGRGALALGLGWALTALVAPDVLFGRLVWTWSQASALTLVAWLVLVAVALGALLIVLAPARAAKNVWGFVGLAGPIAGGLLVVSSLANGDLVGALAGAVLAVLGPLAGLACETLPTPRVRLATSVEGVVVTVALMLWLLLKLHAFVPSNTDENIYFYMAKLVAHGKLPYRDFFFAHPPLHVMLPGLAFAVFGASVTLGKLFPLIATGVIGVGLWRIGRRGFTSDAQAPTPLTRAVGVLALVLFLFAAEPLKASANMTGVNMTTAWLVMGALMYVRSRPIAAGVLFGCAATTGFYAMAAICAFLALGFFRTRSKGKGFALAFGLRQLLAFALVFGLVNLVFYAIGGDGFLDGVYRYHAEKDLRDPAMVELFGGAMSFPGSFLHNLGVTAAGNAFTKEYFYHAHLWLGALALPLLAATRWVAAKRPPVRFFDPRRLADDGALGTAETMWLVALALVLQFTLFRELYSFYFVLLYPFLALVTAYVVLAGFAALARPAAGGWRDRVGLAGVFAALIVAWHPALALANQTVFDDEIEALGERNEYTWTTPPALAWAPVLSDVTRVLFWDDMRVKGDVEPGTVQYLRSKKREFQDLDGVGAWVAAHMTPEESLAGASTLAPLVALVADRRLAADEVDTNNKRFEAKLLTDERYWDAICKDDVKLIVASERSYFTEQRMNTMPTAKRWFRLATVFEDDTLNYRRTFRIPIYERIGDGPCRFEPRP